MARIDTARTRRPRSALALMLCLIAGAVAALLSAPLGLVPAIVVGGVGVGVAGRLLLSLRNMIGKGTRSE